MTTQIFALFATLFLWFESRRDPEYIAISTDYRGANGPEAAFEGHRSAGLYAVNGRIGLLYHEETATAYEPADLANVPYEPTGLLWEHSRDPDGNTYMGGLSAAEISYHVTFSRAGVWLFDGDEYGMSHCWTVRACMIDARLLALILAATLGFVAWRLRRLGRSLARGFAPVMEDSDPEPPDPTKL